MIYDLFRRILGLSKLAAEISRAQFVPREERGQILAEKSPGRDREDLELQPKDGCRLVAL